MTNIEMAYEVVKFHFEHGDAKNFREEMKNVQSMFALEAYETTLVGSAVIEYMLELPRLDHLELLDLFERTAAQIRNINLYIPNKRTGQSVEVPTTLLKSTILNEIKRRMK